MKKNISLNNLHDQQQSKLLTNQKSKLPSIKFNQTSTFNVQHVLTLFNQPEVKTNLQKIARTSSLGILQSGIEKLKAENKFNKAYLHLNVQNRQKIHKKIKTQSQNSSQLDHQQFRIKYFNAIKQQTQLDERMNRFNEQKIQNHKLLTGKSYSQEKKQNPYVIPNRKGFSKCRVKSLNSLQKINQYQYSHQLKNQRSTSKNKSSKSLKLNIRRQVGLLNVPDSKKPLKIKKSQQFRHAIPKQGYEYIQNAFQKYNLNNLQTQKAIQTTVSKFGVLVKQFEETKFYTNSEYNNYLRKIQKLSQVQFFKKFLQIKSFKIWKIYVFSKRFSLVKQIIKQKIPNIYTNQFYKIRKVLDKISSYRFVLLGRQNSLEHERYGIYLHDSSYPILKIVTEQHFLKIIELIMEPIKQKIVSLEQQNEEQQKILQKHKQPYKLTKKALFNQLTSQVTSNQKSQITNNFQKTFKFKNEFLYIQGVIKRVFYIFVTYHIEWTVNIYNEVLSKIKAPLGNYRKIRQKVHNNLNNLFNLKNREEYRYEKVDSYQMQIRLIEYVCRFQDNQTYQTTKFKQNSTNKVKENSLNKIQQSQSSVSTIKKNKKKLFISLTQESILQLFQNFVDHLVKRLSPRQLAQYYKKHLLKQFRMGKIDKEIPQQEQITIQIIQTALSKIDIYMSQNIINSNPDQRYRQKFKNQLTKIVQQNVEQAKQIIQILNNIISDVMQFFHSQNRGQSYILSYSIMEETRQKINLIPDDINVGLFVINILQLKNYICDIINKELEQLTKDLPDEFRSIYNTLYQKLLNFNNKINLSVWSIEQFVVSFQFKEMFQEYRQEDIYKDQQKIKNILSAVNKTLPKIYQECYILFLKFKDMIQKIQTKVQTFDLNCIKKLKFFSGQIENLAESIWRELILVRNKILQVDNFVERQSFVEQILINLPIFEEELKVIKKSIVRLSYIETLQLRFNLKEKLTKDFNLYEKSQSDVKLLQSLLKKLLIFQKNYQNQLLLSITNINADSLLEEINTNKSEIKVSEKYIISYQKILVKIYGIYDSHKIILETADQLGRLEKQDIYDILKLVIVDTPKQLLTNTSKQIASNSSKQTLGSNLKDSLTTSQRQKPKQKYKELKSQSSVSKEYFTLQNLSYFSRKDGIMTLQQTFKLKLYTKYDEIHYQILKKQKKKKMQIIIKNIETNMNDIILEVCNLDQCMMRSPTYARIQSTMVLPQNSKIIQGHNKPKNSFNATKRMDSLAPQQQTNSRTNTQKNEINLHSGFVNLKDSILIIEEILNQLKNIILSPFLEDQRNILLQKIQYVTSNLQILNLLFSAQNKVQRLIEDSILTDAMKQIQKDWQNRHDLFQRNFSKITKEISFDTKLQKDVISAWYMLLRRLSNKKVSQISLCFKQESNDLQNFISRLNSFEKIVNIKIQQKKTMFPLLYFYSNSQILKFVLNPDVFVSQIFPCLKFERKDKKKYTLTTIYGQILQIQLLQEPTLTIKSIYETIKNVLADDFIQNMGNNSLDQLALYCKQKTPLQIAYVVDQLYLQSKYINSSGIVTSQNLRQSTINNLMRQIKIAAKAMNNPIELEIIDYKNILSQMLICARIDYRHRIQSNFVQNYWIHQLLVYHVDTYNKLYFKNLNHLIPVKFCLINSLNLVSLFPNSEKTFVKLCEAFTGQISAIHTKQVEILKVLSAKLMYPIIEYNFQSKIPQDVCKGIVLNFPICFIANFQSINYQVMSKFMRCIQKVRYQLLKEKSIKSSLHSHSKQGQHLFFINSSDSACVFINFSNQPEKEEIPYKLKSMFRSLSSVMPSFQLVFISKLLRADIQSSHSSIQDSLYIVNGYFYLYRQTQGKNPSFTFVNKILSKLTKQLINRKDSQFKQIIQQFFVEYFINLGLDKNSIEHFLSSQKNSQFNRNSVQSSRQHKVSKNLNKKFQFIFKFLIDDQKKEVPSSLNLPTLPTVGYHNKSSYQLKEKIDHFIQSLKQSSQGCFPQQILKKLEQIILTLTNCQKHKPVFIFGDYRTGKTFLIKHILSFFSKYFYKGQIHAQIIHQCQIPKNFLRYKDKTKKIQFLRNYFQGTQSHKQKKPSFVCMEASSSSNQNGLLEVFLNMFQEQKMFQTKKEGDAQMKQTKQKNPTNYIIEIKKMISISPNIFLNTYKYYLPQKLSQIEQITKKWSKQFISRFQIKQKDQIYYTVVNSQHIAFKMIKNIFQTMNTGESNGTSNGIQWIIQPSLANILTSTLKIFDAFIVDITNFQVLFKNIASTFQFNNGNLTHQIKSNDNLIHPSSTNINTDTPAKQKQQQFLKMMAYCNFWALVFCSEQNGYQIIQKFVKDHYYKINTEIVKTKDNFLYKILVIENNQISYNFLKYLQEYSLDTESCQISYNKSSIIQNMNMKVFNYFCQKIQFNSFNNKMSNSILVVGKQEIGKSSYIKNYLNINHENMYIKIKSSDKNVMEKLLSQLSDFKFRRNKNKGGQYQTSQYSMKRKLTSHSQQNIVVWVENIAFYQESSDIQKYLKFLSDHKQYRIKKPQNNNSFITKHLKNLVYFTERRFAQKQFLYENWNLTVLGVSFMQQQIQSVFVNIILQQFQNYIIQESILEELKNKIPTMVNHHMTLLKFCRQNNKPSINNWTFDIGNGKYRNVIGQFFRQKQINFVSGLSPDDIIKHININLFFTLFCCMRNKKDQQLFQNRVTKFLDLDYKEVQKYLLQEQNDLLSNFQGLSKPQKRQIQTDESNTALARLSMKLRQNRFFQNVLVHPSFCKNFQIVSFALKHKKHLLINKKFISRQFSFIEMVLETQGKQWGKLDLIRNQNELNQSISKLLESSLITRNTNQENPQKRTKNDDYNSRYQFSSKKNFYLYVSYEVIKFNPYILDYIKQYIEQKNVRQEQEQQLQQFKNHAISRNKLQSVSRIGNTNNLLYNFPNLVFIIQYSVFQVNLINNYLLNQFPKICTVVRLTTPPLQEYEEVGYEILAKKFQDQDLQIIKNISKTLYTVCTEINTLPLNQISYQKNKFIQSYNLNVRNYAEFVRLVGQLYFQRQRFAQLKRNSLELTLSEIDKILRQFKTLKRDQNIYMTSKKNVLVNIQTNALWLKNAKKKLQFMKIFSVQKGMVKCKQILTKKNGQIQKIVENQKKLTRMSKNLISLISRNQLAQLKYIFVNNFLSMKPLFECICLILGEQTDYLSMKKCLIDLSLANKLKDVVLQSLRFDTVLQIKQKIDLIQKQHKAYSGVSNKTVFQWIKCSTELLIMKNEMQTKLPILQKQKQNIEEQLNRLIETNEIDDLEQQIYQKQNQTIKDRQVLKENEQKLSAINQILLNLQKFDEFLQLKKHCQQQNKALSQIIKQFIFYSILQGVQLVYFNILNQHQKKKFRITFGNFMKRKFGFIANKQKQQIFDKFDEGHTNFNQKQAQSQNSYQNVLKLKHQYLVQTTRSIEYINKILSRNKQTLVIIDPYNSFLNSIRLDTSTLILPLKVFFTKKMNYSDYRTLIIELQDDQWSVNLKELAKSSKNQRKIIQYKKTRIMLPSSLNVIFVKRAFCSTVVNSIQNKNKNKKNKNKNAKIPYYNKQSQEHQPVPFTELMLGFRIFNFQFSQADYYLLIKMTIIQELIKANEHSSLEMIINKQQIIRKSFMGVLYFFCKKTNQFSIKNTRLLKQTIAMIEMWKFTVIQTRGFQYEVFEEKHQKQEIKKIYRILSKLFKLVQMYFNRDNPFLNFDYFISTLTRGAIYGIYNFGDEKYFILQYVISMIAYSLQSKNSFLSMFFMKIYSIQENIGTQMQSDNLTFVMNQFDKLQGFIVQKIQKSTYNYFNHLPYQNKHLQNCYSKILTAQKNNNNSLSIDQINEIIESFDNLSFFKKLVIKRILAPPIFQREMIESVNILSDQIIKNNDNFIKKFFRNGLLFCQCDIYFWKKNIKLKYKYEETILSDISKMREQKKAKNERANILVIDDIQNQNIESMFGNTSNEDCSSSSQRRDSLLKEMVEMEHQNSIFFSHLPLSEQFNKYFKSIPFLLFLELYCFVNIDNHERNSLIEDKEKIDRLGKSYNNNTNIKSQIIPKQTNKQIVSAKGSPEKVSGSELKSQVSQVINTGNNYQIFTSKQIKKHFYSLIQSKATQQRSIAIIRFSNHIPFFLKNQKNQSKILSYYYWKFLIWYEHQQKIIFESIKQKIMKKNNELANKLQHYEQNKQIVKAIHILAPQKTRSQNQEILRIYREYYAVLNNYITKQPIIQNYESDIQRNVFLSESISYEKNIQTMLNTVKDISNILIGKNPLNPQKVKNYFSKKQYYSLVNINDNLIKLSHHREQVNDDNVLTHLNIQLIKQPANIIALFSKPAYKIAIISRSASMVPFQDKNDKSQNLNTQKSIEGEEQDGDQHDKYKGKNSQSRLNKNQISSKSIDSKRSKTSNKKNTKSKVKNKASLKLQPDQFNQKYGKQIKQQINKIQVKRQTKEQKAQENALKIDQRNESKVNKLNKSKQLNQKQTVFDDIFANLLQQKPPSPSSISNISNINTGKKRRLNKNIPVHKIYIYNEYKILLKPIQRKQFEKMNLAQMCRLKLFNGFDLKLIFQRDNSIKNISSIGGITSSVQSFSPRQHNLISETESSMSIKGGYPSKFKNLQKNTQSNQKNASETKKIQEQEVSQSSSTHVINVNQFQLKAGYKQGMRQNQKPSDESFEVFNKIQRHDSPFKFGKSIKNLSQNKIASKKSFQHLKLKQSSSKKLELITSNSPSTLNYVFDSLISAEKNQDDD